MLEYLSIQVVYKQLRIVFDIETNSLVNPNKVFVIVCKDIDTQTYHIFRNLTEDEHEKERFIAFANKVDYWIGHNVLGYDFPHLQFLCDLQLPDISKICDTLVISKLVDYPRNGHSIEDYGIEFNYPKIKFNNFKEYSKEMEDYCIRDVDICHKIFLKYSRYISKKEYTSSIILEQRFQLVVNDLTTNGFSIDITKAQRLLDKVISELAVLDKDILEAFPPKLKMIREVTPKETKYGTISLSSIPKSLRESTSDLSVGCPFCYCSWSSFNPSSHKQIVEVLNGAGWRPVDKTQTHIDTERAINSLKYKHKDALTSLTYEDLNAKLQIMKKAGWKVNENNLDTLPQTAPASARTLAKRILLESRRRTLTEWLTLVSPDSRIHGKFYGIGAWTHRMAHQNPNTANIPNEFDTAGKKKLYGKELRSLWCAPKNRLLVGVDAEGIQLRIFAHYINDPEFTKALVEGKKENGSDPHTLNQRIMGSVCKTRDAAKRYIYALLLGAGNGKLTEILGCTPEEADVALERIMDRYQGFAYLKEMVIPSDAKRGWFTGLDGRAVRIPGDTIGQRRHLCMSGYLQNGEAVVMKKATLKWHDLLKQDNAILVNFVHDEWQTEVPNNMEIALRIANMQAKSLELVGEELGLKCPLAGSYWNDKAKDYTIGTRWSVTH